MLAFALAVAPRPLALAVPLPFARAFGFAMIDVIKSQLVFNRHTQAREAFSEGACFGRLCASSGSDHADLVCPPRMTSM